MFPKPNQVAGINISMSKHDSGSYWIFETLIHQTAEHIYRKKYNVGVIKKRNGKK